MLIVENLTLAAAGGVGGLPMAEWLLHALLHSMPGEVAPLIPGWSHIQIDGRVLGFTALVALGSGIAAGLLPAWSAARHDPNEAVKAGPPSLSGGGRKRAGAALVVGQIAVALALLVLATVFVRGLARLIDLEGARDPSHVLVGSVALPPTRYPDPTSVARFYRQALQRLSNMPGVRGAAMLSTIPLSNNGTSWTSFEIEGRPVLPGRQPGAVLERISPDYFRVLQIGLRSGRAIEPGDREDTTPVAVVSATLAAHLWPHGNPLGKRIRLAPERSVAAHRRRGGRRPLRLDGSSTRACDLSTHGAGAGSRCDVRCSHDDRCRGIRWAGALGIGVA